MSQPSTVQVAAAENAAFWGRLAAYDARTGYPSCVAGEHARKAASYYFKSKATPPTALEALRRLLQECRENEVVTVAFCHVCGEMAPRDTEGALADDVRHAEGCAYVEAIEAADRG